jgi:hypothetical protein
VLKTAFDLLPNLGGDTEVLAKEAHNQLIEVRKGERYD